MSPNGSTVTYVLIVFRLMIVAKTIFPIFLLLTTFCTRALFPSEIEPYGCPSFSPNATLFSSYGNIHNVVKHKVNKMVDPLVGIKIKY